MQLRHRDHSQSGDTIVEVLVCIVIISFMLVGAFVTVRKNLAAERSAQEHDDATQIVQSQQEALRLGSVITSITNDPDMATGKAFFCVDTNPTTGGPAVVKMTPLPGAQITGSTPLPSTTADYGAGSTNAPCAVDNGGIVYHAGASGQEYYLADYYDSADQSYKVVVRWDQLGGGTSTSTSAYRVYSNTVVGIGSSSSIVGPVAPRPNISLNKSTYTVGDPVTVTWSGNGAISCNDSSGTWGTGPRATSGGSGEVRTTDTASPGTISYSITCQYAGWPDATSVPATATVTAPTGPTGQPYLAYFCQGLVAHNGSVPPYSAVNLCENDPDAYALQHYSTHGAAPGSPYFTGVHYTPPYNSGFEAFCRGTETYWSYDNYDQDPSFYQNFYQNCLNTDGSTSPTSAAYHDAAHGGGSGSADVSLAYYCQGMASALGDISFSGPGTNYYNWVNECEKDPNNWWAADWGGNVHPGYVYYAGPYSLSEDAFCRGASAMYYGYVQSRENTDPPDYMYAQCMPNPANFGYMTPAQGGGPGPADGG